MKYEVIEVAPGKNAREVFTSTPHAVTPDGGLVWWDESGGWEMDKEPGRWEIRQVEDHAETLAAVRLMASAGPPLIDVGAHR